ncbi:MAG: polyribonucleotide nucleotidyltransferase [SAR324 cluster bacterium]|nr:polyribonucleotide nucleotidyltransferase [SAR324 cluster bacterium]
MNKFEIEYFGQKITLETGRLAKQANGSVLVSYGDTRVLVTVTAAKSNNNSLGFFPLMCSYQFKSYAMGKIPGGFFKREAKPSDHDTLTSRMMDRPLRPLFPKEYQAETQVIANVLSYDEKSPPEVAAMLGASAALNISDIPFNGIIASAIIGFDGENFTLNQPSSELEKSKLNLILVASKDAITMVEAEAKEVTEDEMLKALAFGQDAIKPLLELQKKLISKLKPVKREISVELLNASLEKKIKKLISPTLEKAVKIKEKKARSQAFDDTKKLVIDKFPKEYEAESSKIDDLIHDVTGELLRNAVLNDSIRVDGRKPDEIRPISCEAGLLPNAHGSALFTRGETQALVVTTLGTRDDEQFIEGPPNPDGFRKNFFLHYNFPSFSVGEVRRMGPPSRREIGHGRLAERSLAQVMPEAGKFPYTIRVVSEILESNGSSSMASICGGSLAMANCDVPLKRPVAGIAMGLIYSKKKSVVLSDILGDEDHLGDMDFKVAGTESGITGLQMDIKIDGLPTDILSQALMQAKDGRLHILKEMTKVVIHERSSAMNNIPKYIQFKVPVSKIRLVIGQGGKTIKGITAKTGARIDINDNGMINISSTSQKKAELALAMIQQVIGELQIGQTYKGIIKKKMAIGFFVQCLPGVDGLVPIAEFTNPNDYNEGQEVNVKVVGYDKQNRLKLSLGAK